MKCPNYSSADWKALEKAYGSPLAHKLYLDNNEDIPSLSRAKELLANKEAVKNIPSITDGKSLFDAEFGIKEKLLDGFNAYYLHLLFGDGDPNMLNKSFETNTRLKQIFDVAYTSIQRDLFNKAEASKNREEVLKLVNIINTMRQEGTKAEFAKAYAKYVKQYNLQIGEAFADETETDSKDTLSTRESTTTPLDDLINKEIKFLIAGLVKPTKNELGLPVLVDYNKTKSLIANKLAGTPAEWELFKSKLEMMALSKPEIKELIKRLENPKYSNSAAQESLKTKFIQSFAKTKTEYFLSLIRDNGNIIFLDSNANKLQNKLKANWEANLKKLLAATNGVFTDTYIGNVVNQLELSEMGFKEEDVRAIGIKRLNALKQAYRLMGIELSDATIKKFENLEVNKDNESLYNILRDIIKYGTGKSGFDLFTTKSDVAGKIKLLLEAEAMFSEEVELQHINSEGKTVYGITLNNFLSLTTNLLNQYSGDKAALQAALPHLFGPYSKNSLILEKIMEGEKISLDVFDGYKIEGSDSGTPTKNLKFGDRVSMLINGALNGFYTYLRAADRGIENGIRLSETKLLLNSRNNAVPRFIKYLEDEIESARAFNMKGVGSNIGYYDKVGGNLRIFKDIIVSVDPKELNRVLVGEISTKEFMDDNKAAITRDINKFFDDEIKRTKDMLDKTGVTDRYEISKDVRGYQGVSQELIEEFGSLDNVVELATINQMAAYIEQTKIFTGDPGFFKTKNGIPVDFFKRTTMANGTKKVSRVGAAFDEWLNNNRKRSDGKLADGIIKTLIFEDSTVGLTEEDIKELTAIFEKAGVSKDQVKGYLEKYMSMDEGDAQGWITLDEYRELLNRAGEWSDEHEKLYQKEIKLQEAIIKGDTEFINKYNPNTSIFLFQPLKTQYFGPLSDTISPEDALLTLFTPTGYKHSLMPLIPSVVKGRNMEGLLKYMAANSQGIAQFRSGNKFGTIVNPKTSKTNSFYAEDGKINTDNLIEQSIDYRYFGIQLDIAPKVKKEITAGTQLRKLVLSNLFDSGRITNENYQYLYNDYINAQSKLIDNALDETIKELGIEPVLSSTNDVIGYVTVDRDKFVDYLKRASEQRTLPDNILDAIDNLKDFDVTIDSLLNKEKITNLLTAFIDNNIIREKRFGGSKIQVSSAGMESNTVARTRKVAGYLRFYTVSKRTGNTIPMEIEQSLPKEWVNMVEKMGGLDKFNELVAETLDQYYKYENNEIENPKYPVDINLLKTVGFRIPTQPGLSSADVAHVRRFLPYSAGDALIVPSQMVAKSGGDFDIDKLNMYFNNVELIASGVPLVKDINRFLKSKGSKVVLTEEILSSILDKETDVLTDTERMIVDYYSKESEKITEVKYIEPSMDTKEGLQNMMLSTMANIITLKENQRQLLAPLTDFVVKDVMLADIDALYPEEANQRETLRDVVSPANNMTKFLNFLSGKAGVGQVAVHGTNHVLAQQAGLYINDDNPSIFFDFNRTMDGYPSIGGVYDVKKKYLITETLSAFLNAYVDIAKDPYIFRLRMGSQTANTVFYMLRLGADPVWVARFINQPIIKEYLDAQSVNESEFKNREDVKGAPLSKSKKTLVQQIINKYSDSTKYDSLLYTQSVNYKEYTDRGVQDSDPALVLAGNITKLKNNYNENKFDLEDLRKMILNKTKMSDKDKMNQVAVLDQFLELQRQSTMIQEMIRATSPDTRGVGKNLNSLKTTLETREKVLEDNFVGNVDKVLNKSVVSSFNNVLNVSNQLMQEFFLSENPVIASDLRRIQGKFMNLQSDPSAKEKVADVVSNEFITYLTMTAINNGKKLGVHYSEVEKMFKGKDSLATKLLDIKKDKSNPLSKNPLIEEFISVFNADNDNIRLFSKRMNVVESNMLTNAFREIFRTDPDFATKLARFGLVQSGLNNSPISYVNIIPQEYYFKVVNPIIKLAKTNVLTVDMQDFEKQLEKENTRLIPRIDFYMNDETGYYEAASYSPSTRKGKFYYMKSFSFDNKTKTYTTMLWERRGTINANGKYSYTMVGPSTKTYLSPKTYKPLASSNTKTSELDWTKVDNESKNPLDC